MEVLLTTLSISRFGHHSRSDADSVEFVGGLYANEHLITLDIYVL